MNEDDECDEEEEEAAPPLHLNSHSATPETPAPLWGHEMLCT
jgi:hypothetical protein